MKSIYQLTALIGNKSDGINDEKFMTAAWILYAWMRREVIDCIPLPELPATVSKSAKTGRSVAAIYQPGQLIDEVGLNDGRQLSTGLQRITTQQVGELADFLCAPDRWLPVVVVS